jgi:hypothetical protein
MSCGEVVSPNDGSARRESTLRYAARGLLTAVGGAASVAIISIGAAVPAAAQDAPWHFAATQYVWAAGIKGSTTTPASGVDFNVDFTDTLKDLSAIPIMLAGEVRKGSFGAVFDIIWLKVASDIDTPRNLLFNDGKAKLSTFQASAIGLYRVVEQPAGNIDVGAGVRLWSVSSRASLNAGLLPAVSAKIDKTFADPVLAARFEFRLGGPWSLTAYGDVGGFGISSDVTWQAIGTVNYKAADWVDMRLGWRHLAVDRSKIKVELSGPVLAATFRF